MSEKIVEVEEEYLNNIENRLKKYQVKYKELNNLKLTNKQITKLRKQISENEDYNSNYLRLISIYTQEEDDILKLFINKLYLSLNS